MSTDGRMAAEARRGVLVATARTLFAVHGYERLSMAQLARAAGISKPLLYHYFPSKQALFAAALQQTADELGAALRPDPSRPPTDQLAAGLLSLLEWVDANQAQAAALLRSLAVVEVAELVAEARGAIALRILDGLGPDGGSDRAAVQLAVHAWLRTVEGACLAWVERGLSVTPAELQGVLLGSLGGSLMGAGQR
ncbi:TetR/AcrR family transcriptional regulator [Conexibacter arvalis]|uniref:AcrR family transcriptional regulator n=1 Tax=Conexibacter arvalis TaxID=912552 RepID=A0A840IHY4_9ACTN|nr:TetR/AcrR family transcriptional regulator [Conexibacter arvalis]MBB4663783.1 AcrR family transcriptional regulator [Conexibacter arvalis]